MIVLPVFVAVFFTSMMNEGQPQEMPVGIVDNDNTSMTRSIEQHLDGMQTSHIVQYYNDINEARTAMQKGEIYAFLYIPKGTTAKLLASRQPHISYYYTNTSLTAGSLLYRDLKTVTTLAAAGVAQATMRAKGMTEKQIMTFLQPINIDLHTIGNPWVNYNVYLSTMLIPGCMMLFIMLLTAYTLGSEVKKGTSRELMDMAGGSVSCALMGKLLIQTLTFVVIMQIHMWYLFSYLGFPHQSSAMVIILLATLCVLAGQAFGVMAFAALPSMRMSMSICSLWSVLSFSMVGTAFPLFAMDAPIEMLSWLFPLRHYFVIYSQNIFHGLPISYTYIHWAVLIVTAATPLLCLKRINSIYSKYIYLE